MLSGKFIIGKLERDMPFKRQIADVENEIEELRMAIAIVRETGNGGARATLERMLGQLARLNAERLRLMQRQRRASP